MGRPYLESKSPTLVRVIFQFVPVLLFLVVWQEISFPIEIKLLHIGGVLLVTVVLAEIYLSLSGRSLLRDETEDRLNSAVFGLAQLNGMAPLRAVLRFAEHRNETIHRRKLLAEAEKLVTDIEEIVIREFNRPEWLDGSCGEIAEEVIQTSHSSDARKIKEVICPRIFGLPTADRLAVTIYILIIRLEESDDGIYTFKDAISECLENFDFTNPSEPELRLLSGYLQIDETADSRSDSSDKLFLDPDDIEDPEQVYEELMDTYYPFGKSYPEYNKTSLREYKQNIASLIQSQLSIGDTQSKVLSAIEDERERLKTEIGGRDTYLLAFRILNTESDFSYAELDELIASRYPEHIKSGRTWTFDPEMTAETHRDSEMKHGVRVSMWLVSIDTHYPSGSAFYRTELKDTLPEYVVGYATKVKTPLGPEYDREYLYTVSDNREKVDETISQARILFSGQTESDITVQAIENMVNRNVSTEELLGAVQLDSITDATKEESEMFSDHRDEIERALAVSSVFDWVNVEPNKAGYQIAEILPQGTVERWESLVSELVSTIQKCKPPSR